MQPHKHYQHSPDSPGDIKGFEAGAEITGVLPKTAGVNTAVVKGGRQVDTIAFGSSDALAKSVLTGVCISPAPLVTSSGVSQLYLISLGLTHAGPRAFFHLLLLHHSFNP